MIGLQRRITFAGITGIILGFCYVAGYSLDNFDTLNLMEGSFYGKWFAGSVLASLIVYCLFYWVERISGRVHQKKQENTNIIVRPIPYWVCVLVLLLGWLPAWLSIFPGAFNYDALSEWQQVAQGHITAHHPVIHVLVLGGLVEAFYALTGSYNVGIAIYTLLQMLILANVFALVIGFMEKLCVPVWLRVTALIFWSCSPVVQLHSISATKDTLFSAAELLFFCYVLLFYCRREEFFAYKKNLWGFGAVAFFTMILRNNGFYIVVLTLAIMAFPCFKMRIKIGKQCLAVLLGIGLLYGSYVGPLYSALEITPGGVEEMLSVPIQQLARVHRYEYESLEQEDLDLLYKVIPKEALDNYRPTVSDFVKKDFNRAGFEENKLAFIKLWAKWGVEHPLSYVNSFLINTVDFWYPNAVVDGYRDAYGKSSFFDYQVDKPGTEVVLLEKVHDFYEKLSHEEEAQTAPFAFLVLSPGWYVLSAMVIMLYLWCYKRYEFMVPMFILVLSLLTVLLGPIALVRYVLVFYYVYPVLLTVLLASSCFKETKV